MTLVGVCLLLSSAFAIDVQEEFSLDLGGFNCKGNATENKIYIENGKLVWDKQGNDSSGYRTWMDCNDPSTYTGYVEEGSTDYFYNFYMTAEIYWLGGKENWAGIHCGTKGSNSGRYIVEFLIHPLRYVSIVIWDSYTGFGDTTILNQYSDWVNSSGSNQLSIFCQDSIFIFYLNGHEVYAGPVARYSGGSIGIDVQSQTKIGFDNFIVSDFDKPSHLIYAAEASLGGKISPSGDVIVKYGANQTFYIKAESGYRISNVMVDDVLQGPKESYPFTNVTEDHYIYAFFEEDECGTDDYSDCAGYATLIQLEGDKTGKYSKVVSGNIHDDYDDDWFEIDLQTSGTLKVYTTGSTDTMGCVACNSCTDSNSQIDYNSGDDDNFYVEKIVEAGSYWIAVSADNSNTFGGQRGDYELHIEFIPSWLEVQGNADITKAHGKLPTIYYSGETKEVTLTVEDNDHLITYDGELTVKLLAKASHGYWYDTIAKETRYVTSVDMPALFTFPITAGSSAINDATMFWKIKYKISNPAMTMNDVYNTSSVYYNVID